MKSWDSNSVHSHFALIIKAQCFWLQTLLRKDEQNTFAFLNTTSMKRWNLKKSSYTMFPPICSLQTSSRRTLENINSMLQLGMPNSVLTDLVISFLFPPYLIRLTYDSHAVPMLLFSFHIMPHALLIPFISVQCMAMLFLSSLPFCHCHAVASCFTSLPFHGHA